MVPGGGIEPPRAEARRILSPSYERMVRNFSELEGLPKRLEPVHERKRA